MKSFLSKNRPTLIVVLSIILIGIIFFGLFRKEYLSFDLLRTEKDTIIAISSIFTMIFFLVGSIASYYKFFRGRIFSQRADLKIEVDIIQLPAGDFHHSLKVSVQNIGTMPIWDVKPHVTVETLGETMTNTFEIAGWDQNSLPDGVDRSCVIEAGETSNFFVRQLFDSNVVAVTYLASISSDSGDLWSTQRTIANREKS